MILVMANSILSEPGDVAARIAQRTLARRGADYADEVRRLLDLGARHADVGQAGDEPWTVLADPEGNEFCVLAGRRP